MTHTKRIYNNPNLKKAQRYTLDNPNALDPTFGFPVSHQVGIPLTKRSWICMGKCPMCRDPNREPRKIRRQNKEQLRVELKNL